jgi:hypothetical protein
VQARQKELLREIEFLRELNNSLLSNQKALLVRTRLRARTDGLCSARFSVKPGRA